MNEFETQNESNLTVDDWSVSLSLVFVLPSCTSSCMCGYSVGL